MSEKIMETDETKIKKNLVKITLDEARMTNTLPRIKRPNMCPLWKSCEKYYFPRCARKALWSKCTKLLYSDEIPRGGY